MTTTTLPSRSAARTGAQAMRPPAVDVVVPVLDEARVLETSICRLHAYLSERFPLPWRITIADNGSTDGTWPLAERLAEELAGVHAVRTDRRGRGHALHLAWSGSDALVVAYMDVDLSTDLDALLPLVAPLLSGHSDVAIGTRLSRQARVVRGPKRELVSRGYNTILRAVLGVRFTDAQCGFKAVRRDRAAQLLPEIRDRGWFFDTELLVLAERAGLRVHEVPVDWVEDRDSKVDVVATAVADLKGVVRLLTARAGAAPVGRFAAVGIASTLAYLALFAALRGDVGSWWANAFALAVTAVANTLANRRVTFGVSGRADAWRHLAQGLGVFVLALMISSAGLAAVRAADPNPGAAVDITALVAANAAATVLRYVLLRRWVFPVTRAA